METNRSVDKRRYLVVLLASLATLAVIGIVYKSLFGEGSQANPRTIAPTSQPPRVPVSIQPTHSGTMPVEGPPVQVFRGEPFEVPAELMNPEPPGDPAFTPAPPPPGLEFDPTSPIDAPPEPPSP